MSKRNFNDINKYRTAIMGFAALWIYFYHEQGYEWCHVYFSPQIVSRLLYFIKRLGFCGVDIFLLLSGIGLVYAIEKSSIGTFYRRRLERVFVPFVILGVCTAFVEKWSIASFFRKIFFYDFFFVNTISFLWYIPSVIILYLFFPLYYRYFKKSQHKFRFTLIFILIWLVLTVLFKDFIRYDFYRFTNRIPVFLCGILSGWLIREEKLCLGKLSWVVLGISFAAGILLGFLTVSRGVYLLVPMSFFGVPAFLIGIAGTAFLAKGFSLVDNKLVGNLIVKFFSFFGSFSLEIYCVQDLIDDVFRTMMMSTYEHWMENWWKIDIAVFLCTIAAAFILSFISDKIRSSLNKLR